MTRRSIWPLILLVLICGLGIGFFAARSATEADPVRPQVQPAAPTRPVAKETSAGDPKTSLREDRPNRADLAALDAGALPGQRELRFRDAASLQRFLDKLHGSGVVVLDRIDALLALRVGFLDPDALAALLEGSEQSGFIFPVDIPQMGSVQDGAVGFGSRVLDWLGLPADRSGWGSGVTVAVIDSGFLEHPSFANAVRLVDLLADPAATGAEDHGTAVASMIASAFGIAPDADLLTYRVADADGRSDSFTLAKAILAAADGGADLINISMGSHGDSSVLREAVEYAASKGAVVVASAGNNGIEGLTYPAAYPSVIGVGAVDARGERLDFSNSGELALTAPGLGIAAAGPQQTTIYASGTSFSAPLVTGSIAALMSTQRLTAEQAVGRLIEYSNEAGAPGTDPDYGNGVLDTGRAIHATTPGRADIAVASNYYVPESSILYVTVENRGTTAIANSPLTVSTPAGTTRISVSSLATGNTATYEIPFDISVRPAGETVTFDSSINLSGGREDINPSNNRRTNVVSQP